MPDFRRQMGRQRVTGTNESGKETSRSHDALVVLRDGTEQFGRGEGPTGDDGARGRQPSR